MDVEVIKSFNPLLFEKYAFAIEDSNGRIEAGVFGAEKGLGYLKKCLDYYNDRPFKLANDRFDVKVLPIIMIETLQQNYINKKRYNIKLLGNDDTIELFPQDYFTAKSYKTGRITCTMNTYTIHHFAGSWLSPYRKFIKIFSRYMGDSVTRKLHLVKQLFQSKINK
ncbi:MAG: hypothetical protein R3Y26_07160 [Rikenellaceae bacterium]